MTSASTQLKPTPKTADDFMALGHTPMMAQYHVAKVAHPDCLLFYRMGDFYEMFFDDAIIASKVLDLTLTRRGKTQGDEIPMCGVPYHAADGYIARLIRAGHKVGICEQVETPEEAKKRGGSKALVQRDVVRVITPGTILEDSLLDARANNYLVAVSNIGGQAGLAIADVSTGEFLIKSMPPSQIGAALQRLSPGEILCAYGQEKSLPQELQSITTSRPDGFFESDKGYEQLENLFGPLAFDDSEEFNRAEVAAAGALIDYIDETQKGQIPYLSVPQRLNDDDTLEIDPSTLRSLELTRTQSGNRAGSLIETIDLTQTGAGARLLQSRLLSPLRNLTKIAARHDEIATLITQFDLTKNIRATLRAVPDMERALARLSLNRGGPRDLAALRDGMAHATILRMAMLERGLNNGPLKNILDHLALSEQLEQHRARLQDAIIASPPILARDGGFIADGFCPNLDHLRGLRNESQRHIAALQTTYVSMTGIETLKITHNNILGYYIEVPARRADAMMVKSGDQTNPFIHRQTMASGVRFTTPDLSNLEREIAASAEKALAIELGYFNEFQSRAMTLAEEINQVARGLSMLDVAAAMATLAVDRTYARPTITAGDDFVITGGRHPVVEQALRAQHQDFIPNNCNLAGNERLWLLTGPNMAGKSTFLRQNALIAIMAQAGFYVPATSATIGAVDKVFSRVGASDDLARGHSTFMMEMVETAAILKNATSKSLVILDEVGRGTSTFDGLSIAWATLEFLHNNLHCRGLFATHYHELTNLQTSLKTLACYTMDVKEWHGDVIFLHAVKSGTADRSYGIHVAKLAGVPGDVLARAEQVLHLLETSKPSSAKVGDLPLFQSPPPAPSKPKISAVEEQLKAINPDSLSPREALEQLYSLRSLLGKS